MFIQFCRGENKQSEQNKLEFEKKQETEDLFITMFIVLRVPQRAKECPNNCDNETQNKFLLHFDRKK